MVANTSPLILAIDQGTTSTRAIIMNLKGEIISQHQVLHEQIFPNKAWVEHDPEALWQNTLFCCHNSLKKASLTAKNISCIGITNQRETTIAWDKSSGKAVYPAIVWQDRRTAALCHQLKQENHEVHVTEKTGLILDPYFSATKLAWILDNVAGARKKALAGELLFGTVDTYLLWKLTGGKVHATDVTNASRTCLFNLKTLNWDEELCNLFNVPLIMLPEVKSSDAIFGHTQKELFGDPIIISGIVGDQQAAAIGQGCITPGSIKSTYGTGCFMLMNTGTEYKYSSNRLLTTILYKINGQVTYALEGSIFIAGAGITWLKDNLNIISNIQEVEQMASALKNNEGVYFVPALTGLGAPFWQPEVRGIIYGLSIDSKKEHIVRAMLEAIGYQTKDLLEAMQKDANIPITSIKVDGGLTKIQWLMQWLANILSIEIYKRDFIEVTACGAGLLAAIGAGLFSNINEIEQCSQTKEVYNATSDFIEPNINYQTWKKLIGLIQELI